MQGHGVDGLAMALIVEPAHNGRVAVILASDRPTLAVAIRWNGVHN